MTEVPSHASHISTFVSADISARRLISQASDIPQNQGPLVMSLAEAQKLGANGTISNA